MSQDSSTKPKVSSKNFSKRNLYFASGVALAAILAFTLVLIFANQSNSDVSTVDDIALTMRLEGGDDIDWSNYPEYSLNLSESYTITQPGIYTLTGEIGNGVLTVDCSDNVKLILNNLSIKNSSGPALLIAEAKNTVIYTMPGSTNKFEDSQAYSGFAEDEIGTIFSHDDLILSGDGTLEVISYAEDAIVSKDDLKILSGTYEIKSADDAIRGKDSVHITGGTFRIDAGGDGIKSTNTIESNKGFIYIEDGDFDIIAAFDGIQAETNLRIADGDFTIKTADGSAVTSTNSSSWGHWASPATNITSDSTKGLKAGTNIVIEGGTFTIDSTDDAIHSNSYVGIKDGQLSLQTGDDGIHAGNELIIDGGTITIAKSYEGLEATDITINGGQIKVTASDDGLNAAGGNDGSAMGRPGANNRVSDENGKLTISGGTIIIDAAGDGLDSNGNIYQTGGDITIYGPTDSMNGAIDYEGSYIMSGGTLLAGSANGMVQNISQDSSIPGVLIGFNGNVAAQSIVTIEEEGNEVFRYTSAKSFGSLVVASVALKEGKTYTIKINNETYATFTVSGITTNVGNGGFPGGMNNIPGRGAGGPNR